MGYKKEEYMLASNDLMQWLLQLLTLARLFFDASIMKRMSFPIFTAIKDAKNML